MFWFIRALKKCLTKTEQYHIACTNLFVSTTKRKKQMFRNTITIWIRSVINHMYGFTTNKDRRSVRVKVSKVWTIGTSLLFRRSCASRRGYWGRFFCALFCTCYSSLLSLSISSLPQFLCYQSVGTAAGPTALCGIRTTLRSEILSPEIQPSDPLVEWAGIEPASLGWRASTKPTQPPMSSLASIDGKYMILPNNPICLLLTWHPQVCGHLFLPPYDDCSRGCVTH